ncbi:hypothetical protein KYTH14_02840 [Helicobacter pylori]
MINPFKNRSAPYPKRDKIQQTRFKALKKQATLKKRFSSLKINHKIPIPYDIILRLIDFKGRV